MKNDTTAYLAYGVKIPNSFNRTIEKKLEELNEQHDMRLTHLWAGRYDREDLYLVVKYFEAEIGEAASIDLSPCEGRGIRAIWTACLKTALGELRIEDAPMPGWLLIADQS